MNNPGCVCPDPLVELETLVRARYPLIYVTSFEEERVEEALGGIARKRSKRLVLWSCVRGLHLPGEAAGGSKRSFSASTTDPLTALDEVFKQVEPTIYLFKDLHPFLGDHSVVRKLRELAQHLKASPKTLVVVSPVLRIPPEVEKDVTVIDFPLPGVADLQRLVESILRQFSEHGKAVPEIPESSREKLLKAALGLTLKEAENAFARTLIQRRKLGEEEVPLILEEKRRVIRKSGILDYFSAQESLESVGGLENLKEWLRKRSRAFTDEARSFGLPPPKGVLLLGVQGCGKSLCARAVSNVWGLPLLRLDVGKIFSSLVGSSEENVRRAIATAESVAPCILWVDEIEKALAGGSASGELDSGTTARVFATFLTWLQEKTAPVFVIATANKIENLPPELMRKGRFDDIFFVDLPSAPERREIFAIHIAARGRQPAAFDLDLLAGLSEGFSGSEIEQAVVAALYEAFDRGRDLITDDLVRVLESAVPLSRTMEGPIAALRRWAAGRARAASAHPVAVS